VFADAASVNGNAPKEQHGLSTLSKRALSTMSLPRLPQGVTPINNGMLPSTLSSNPFKHISWAFTATAKGT